ncbi:MAG: hypothetical protein A2X58_14265 [Nitrospirae bacterium GWC2_56_14]|nr:MAG: hypothetical protein A2X58_14265 [Nitrospirae bacterium GWC2_56_14]
MQLIVLTSRITNSAIHLLNGHADLKACLAKAQRTQRKSKSLAFNPKALLFFASLAPLRENFLSFLIEFIS